jgi:hypothetical protein
MPPVFCVKSVEDVENICVSVFPSTKEFIRVSKQTKWQLRVESRRLRTEDPSLAMLARDSDTSSHWWLTITGPSPRVFPEVFILKTDKVVCFD